MIGTRDLHVRQPRRTNQLSVPVLRLVMLERSESSDMKRDRSLHRTSSTLGAKEMQKAEDSKKRMILERFESLLKHSLQVAKELK